MLIPGFNNHNSRIQNLNAITPEKDEEIHTKVITPEKDEEIHTYECQYCLSKYDISNYDIGNYDMRDEDINGYEMLCPHCQQFRYWKLIK
jgi:hypothetical protein